MAIFGVALAISISISFISPLDPVDRPIIIFTMWLHFIAVFVPNAQMYTCTVYTVTASHLLWIDVRRLGIQHNRQTTWNFSIKIFHIIHWVRLCMSKWTRARACAELLRWPSAAARERERRANDQPECENSWEVRENTRGNKFQNLVLIPHKVAWAFYFHMIYLVKSSWDVWHRLAPKVPNPLIRPFVRSSVHFCISYIRYGSVGHCT